MKTFVLVVAVAASVPAAALAQPFSDLMVENSAPALADPDTDVTFAITVTNNGPDPAAGAALDVPLPGAMTFVSLSQPAGWTCTTPAAGAGGTVSCSAAADLAAAASAAFSLVAHVPAATPAGTFFTSIASATTATSDPTGENDAATAVVQTPPLPASDLMVTLRGPSGSNPGVELRYAIEVQNGGPGAASNFTFEQTLPANTTLVSFVQDSGPALACNTAAAPITCSAASLAAGASAAFTLALQVAAPLANGTLIQAFARVGADYDPNDENDESTAVTCLQADSCSAGACNSNIAVVCAARDECHDPGTCNSVSGECSPDVPKANGVSCDDGDLCTQSDRCQSGVCTGGDPVICPVAGACELQGTCDPGSGLCAANGDAPDDTPCDDGDGCTQTDRCASGACVGSNPKGCPAAGACEEQGTCEPSTGKCAANPRKADGSSCDDDDACTGSSSCQAGVCTGSNAVVCPLAGSCQTQGTCDPTTGSCGANAAKSDGAACDDGDWCTGGDACLAGSCTGSAISCDDGDACTSDSCAPASGCAHAALACDASTPAQDAAGPSAGAGAGAGAGGGGGAGGTGAGGTGGSGTKDSGVGGDAGARADAGETDGGVDAGDAGISDGGVDGDCNCRVGIGARRGQRTHAALAAALLALALFTRRTSRTPRRR